MNRFSSRTEPGRWAGALFSLAMHGVLALVLVYGVQWQRREPEAVSATLVASLPPIALPPVQPPQPEVEPTPPPPPPKVEPVKEPEPVAKPDIAIKTPEKKKPEPPKPEKKPEPPKPEPKPEKKPEPKPEPKPEKKPEPKPAPSKPAEPKLSPMEQLMQREQDRAQQAQVAAQNQAHDARMRALLDAQGNSAAMGTALAGWSSKISAKVRSNVVLPQGFSGNPELIFEIELSPTTTGAVVLGEPKLVKSSGYSTLDEAVKRAILKSDPLPMPDRKEVFQRRLRLVYTPYEKQ